MSVKNISLMAPEGFPLVQQGDDLVAMISLALKRSEIDLQNHDVLVLAQKIVSKSEGRFRTLSQIIPSKEAIKLAKQTEKDPRLVQAILDESTTIIRKRPGVIIVRHKNGWIMAQAGIDQSNVEQGDDRLLLLPENPDASAAKIRTGLEDRLGISLAVVIADSFGRPFRLGTTGVAIGAAGLSSMIDKRGDRDLFGRELKVSMIALADEVATAASMVMGQANEGMPIAIVRGLPKSPHLPASSLIRPLDEDMFTNDEPLIG